MKTLKKTLGMEPKTKGLTKRTKSMAKMGFQHAFITYNHQHKTINSVLENSKKLSTLARFNTRTT